jgi:hypothetical protein
MKTNTAALPLNPKRIPFEAFVKRFGRTRATGWRWRKMLPWLDITNVFGRNYISLESVRRFEELAAQGKLAMRTGLPPGRGRKSKSASVKQ